MTEPSCLHCPINMYSTNCNDLNSTWDKLFNELYQAEASPKKTIHYTEKMLTNLEWVCDCWLNNHKGD